MFTALPYRVHDFYVNYRLPDEVETDIPRHDSEGGLGVHEWARGILVEVCRYLEATPLSLTYEEQVDPATRHHLRSLITAVVDHDGNPVTVVYTFGASPSDRSRENWDLTVDEVLVAQDQEPTPSRREVALLVRRHLRGY